MKSFTARRMRDGQGYLKFIEKERISQLHSFSLSSESSSEEYYLTEHRIQISDFMVATVSGTSRRSSFKEDVSMTADHSTIDAYSELIFKRIFSFKKLKYIMITFGEIREWNSSS